MEHFLFSAILVTLEIGTAAFVVSFIHYLKDWETDP